MRNEGLSCTQGHLLYSPQIDLLSAPMISIAQSALHAGCESQGSCAALCNDPEVAYERADAVKEWLLERGVPSAKLVVETTAAVRGKSELR
eukprot:6471869-Amphidinium_carterae.1